MKYCMYMENTVKDQESKINYSLATTFHPVKSATKHKVSKNGLIIVVLTILIILIFSGVYFLTSQRSVSSDETLVNANVSKSPQEIFPTDTPIPTPTPTIPYDKDCTKQYTNKEVGFSFEYACRWGDVKEKWIREGSKNYDGSTINGNQLSITFSNILEVNVGGASNGFFLDRGIDGVPFADSNEGFWSTYIKDCNQNAQCLINGNKISYLELPELMTTKNMIRFSSDLSLVTYINIPDNKISIIGFIYYLPAHKSDSLDALREEYPNYVAYRDRRNITGYKVEDNLEKYNSDVQKMRTRKIVDDFDQSTKEFMAEYNALITSFSLQKLIHR